MSGWKTDILFDTANPSNQDSDNIGAFVRAGSDGDLIASQTIAAEEWLNTAAALFSGDGTAITETGGALDVNIASGSISIGSDKAEDAAHTSGDTGSYVLSVRVDDLTSVPASVLAGTEGDYQSLITDTAGALFTASKTLDGSGNAIGSTSGSLDVNVTNTIDVDDGLANTDIQNAAVTVGTTEVSTGTALASRKYLWLFNASNNRQMYIGDTGVTTSNGFPMPRRTGLELRVGASVDVRVIANGAGADLRTLELS